MLRTVCARYGPNMSATSSGCTCTSPTGETMTVATRCNYILCESTSTGCTASQVPIDSCTNAPFPDCTDLNVSNPHLASQFYNPQTKLLQDLT